MSISVQDIKKLRDATGVGMMDCKKALKEADGDFEAAVELLRKKGQKVAAKRADRTAEEGLVVTRISDDESTGAIVEVNCETDFVARNDDFQTFAATIADQVLAEQPSALDALKALPFDDDHTIDEELAAITGRIGEKIAIRRFDVLDSDAGTILSYVHPGSKLGVLIEVTGDGDVHDAGRDAAMQVAAMNPIAVRREEVSEEKQEKEMEIAREAALNEGKPEHVIDNIVQGKLNRFFEDNVLLEQKFVKDGSMSVGDMLDEAGVDVQRFVRYALGN
ncbi:translation elongation factor Ts [Salisaeta longa]|uniref:translation elongation factor Ts n=1 Tax=Salisaeta longa TaxID=503170 RepID=UPI0003B59100|nr:translation elongation factor Ts [Salisaeta longa]